MRVPIYAIMALAAALVGPSYASAETVKESHLGKTSAGDPEDIICESGKPLVGSRLPGPRICHTRKVWEQIHRDAKDFTDHRLQRGDSAGMPGGG